MTHVEALLEQTHQAHRWLNRIIDSIPQNLWNDIPENLNTNVAWQIGHVIVSEHYHGVMSTIGIQKELMEALDIRTYVKRHAFGSTAHDIGPLDPVLLLDHLNQIQEATIQAIQSLKDEDLPTDLVPSKRPHPVAKTKFEVISWNVQHLMWHCGQLAMLKRVLTSQSVFG